MGDLKKTLSCDRCNTIFVDCFDTIIFRRIKPKEVFNRWAEKLSEMYNLPHKKIYQIFTKTNFNMCLKKMIISFTLQESFDKVIEKFYNRK